MALLNPSPPVLITQSIFSYTERLEKLQNTMDDRKKQNQDVSDLQQQIKELKLEEEQLKEKEKKLNKQVTNFFLKFS